jgi:hypothetical protein
VLGYTGFASHQIKFGVKKLGSTAREVLGTRSCELRPSTPLYVRDEISDRRATVAPISRLRRGA